mgnify:FL=1
MAYFNKEIVKVGGYPEETISGETAKVIGTGSEKKALRIRAYRREASRLASMANKRLIRLESNHLTDSPAYKKLVTGDGKPRFSVRGKSYNEVQSEVARLHNFLNAKTSTVRGASKVLKEMAKNTGIKYKNLKELKKKAGQFFNLASKIEQYLRTVEDMASAIGYQKIWEQVNKYVKQNNIALDKDNVDIEELTKKIVEAMDIYDKKTHFKVNDEPITGWFKLSKD